MLLLLYLQLDTWWLQYAYMDFRLPLAPFLNFAGPGPYMFHHLPKKPGSAVERAALLTYLNNLHWHLLKQYDIHFHIVLN